MQALTPVLTSISAAIHHLNNNSYYSRIQKLSVFWYLRDNYGNNNIIYLSFVLYETNAIIFLADVVNGYIKCPSGVTTIVQNGIGVHLTQYVLFQFQLL
jgi:hypothetical protein